MKKSLLLFIPALILSSCSGNNSSKTLISFLGWGSTYEKSVFNEMISAFKQLHPDYDVAYRSVSSENYEAELRTLRQTDSIPDVFYMPDINFIEFVNSKNNIMMDLDPYIKESKTFSLDNIWSEGKSAYQFTPGATKSDVGTLGSGHLYALPKDVGPMSLTYNKTNATKKGITISHDTNSQYGYDADTKTLYDQIPMTWAQFIKFCSDTQTGDPSASDSIVGVSHYPLEIAYLCNGGKFLDKTNKIANIANDQFSESFQFVADLSLKYNIMTPAKDQGSGGQDGYSRFFSGLASTSFVDFYKTSEMWGLNFEWDLLPSPVPNASGDLDDWKDAPRTGVKSQSYLGSVGIAVSSKSKVPQAAYELAEFLTVNQDAQRINYKMGQAIPNLMDMAKGEFQTAVLNDEKAEWNRPANRKVLTDIAENSQRRPQAYTYQGSEKGKWYNELWDCSTNEYKLYRVFNNDSLYGGHIDVWDWSKKQRINNDFLDTLQNKVQEKLNSFNDKYNWAE